MVLKGYCKLFENQQNYKVYHCHYTVPIITLPITVPVYNLKPGPVENLQFPFIGVMPDISEAVFKFACILYQTLISIDKGYYRKVCMAALIWAVQ